LQNPTELAERVESGGKIGAYVAWGIAAFFILLAFAMGKKTTATRKTALKLPNMYLLRKSLMM